MIMMYTQVSLVLLALSGVLASPIKVDGQDADEPALPFPENTTHDQNWITKPSPPFRVEKRSTAPPTIPHYLPPKRQKGTVRPPRNSIGYTGIWSATKQSSEYLDGHTVEKDAMGPPALSHSPSPKRQKGPARPPRNPISYTGVRSITEQPSPSEYLDAHNTLRAKHGASPLTWSDTLATVAKKLADSCIWGHSQGEISPFGVNLAAGSCQFNATDAIALWEGEEGEFETNSGYDHYTQMIWKGTTQLGCAAASCSNLFDWNYVAQFHVCEYNPPGNVIGQLPQNVS